MPRRQLSSDLAPALVVALGLASGVAAQRAKAPATPQMPYIAAGACPFEGCAYGEWTSRDVVKVRRSRERGSSVVFDLPSGTTVTAITGAVIVRRPGRVEFNRASQLTSLDGTVRVQAGDTLFLLSYIGEGFTNAWYKGRVFRNVDGALAFFNGSCADEPAMCSGKVVDPPLTEWWVQLRTSDGRTGWTDEPEKFDGKNRIGI